MTLHGRCVKKKVNGDPYVVHVVNDEGTTYSYDIAAYELGLIAPDWRLLPECADPRHHGLKANADKFTDHLGGHTKATRR